MPLFKLKTSQLALVFSVVALIFHLGIGYLLAALIKNQMLASIWQRSLKIYWPAMDLIQILRSNVNVGVLMGVGVMILAALLELWVIFSVSIWLVRLHFRKPPISNILKMAILVIVLIIGVCFYKASPVALGDPRSPLEQAMGRGDAQSFENILKSNPSLANKRGWANNTPLNAVIDYQHPKEFIDLLVKYGADINAKGEPFDTTPLQHAAWSGKIEAVRALLAHRPDVNAMNDSKNGVGDDSTALNFAFVADNKEIFNLLLAASADINHGRSVLAECMVYGGRDSWAEFLLTNGADPNRLSPKGDEYAPIIQAVLNGNTNYVAALLRHHVDTTVRYINGGDNFSPLELALDEGKLDVALLIADASLQIRTNSVSLAAAQGDLESLSKLLQTNPASIGEKDDLGFTPLHWAAEAGQKDAAEMLLTNGANPNAKDTIKYNPLEWAAYMGREPLVELLAAKAQDNKRHGERLNTSLVLAVQKGHLDVAQFLLKEGADVNAVNPFDRYHSSPLHFAASGGSIEMVQLLLSNGASVAALNAAQQVPLHLWAYSDGDPQIADLLFSKHADVNAKDGEGKTPLHMALFDRPRYRVQKQTVEWLLKHGADINAKDSRGVTSLDFLKSRHGSVPQKDIADLLRKYGAKD